MKKLFTILAILASTGLFAQDEFAPLGSSWTYKGLYVCGSSGSYNLEKINTYSCVATDTVDGNVIKAIKHTQKQQFLHYSNGTSSYTDRTSDTILGVDSIYEANDTVFIKNQFLGKYTPLYVFNVQEGDTLRLPVLDDEGTQYSTQFDSTFMVIIDSVRMTNYSGQVLQTFYTTSYDNGINKDSLPFVYLGKKPSYNWYNSARIHIIDDTIANTAITYRRVLYKGAYTRLFGGTGAGLKPKIEYFSYLPTASYCIKIDTISCFNGNVSFNLSSNPCDSFSVNTLSLTSISSLSNIKLFPNPVLENEVFIQTEKAFSNETKLHILDILGKEVLTPIDLSNQSSKTINVSSLHAGVYFLVFESDGQRYYQKFQKL